MSDWIEIFGHHWYLVGLAVLISAAWLARKEISAMIMWAVERRTKQRVSLILSHLREADLHGITLIELKEKTRLKLRKLEPLLDELSPEKVFFHGGRWYLNTPRSGGGNRINRSL